MATNANGSLGKMPLRENHTAYGNKSTAVIICGIAQRKADLSTLAMACNCLLIDSDSLLVSPHEIPKADFLLVDLNSISGQTEEYLSIIARYLSEHRSDALVWTDMRYLETAYAVLPEGQCHYMVDASDFEAMPILSGAYGRGTMERLHDRGHSVEFGSLHRISDELAEFARTLARMADKDGTPGLADKPVSFRPAPLGGFQPFPMADLATETVSITAASIRRMIKMRRLRDSFFDHELFADPAWDILLDLMAAQLEGKQVSISSLCIAASVPPTTALRWITTMTENGMLVRQHDPGDARRVFIGLSEETSNKMLDYLADVRRRSAQPV
jgi:hypothetical protein